MDQKGKKGRNWVQFTIETETKQDFVDKKLLRKDHRSITTSGGSKTESQRLQSKQRGTAHTCVYHNHKTAHLTSTPPAGGPAHTSPSRWRRPCRRAASEPPRSAGDSGGIHSRPRASLCDCPLSSV